MCLCIFNFLWGFYDFVILNKNWNIHWTTSQNNDCNTSDIFSLWRETKTHHTRKNIKLMIISSVGQYKKKYIGSLYKCDPIILSVRFALHKQWFLQHDLCFLAVCLKCAITLVMPLASDIFFVKGCMERVYMTFCTSL